MSDAAKGIKVLLVQPPSEEGPSGYELPLNLAYLASTLLHHGIKVSIVDLQHEDTSRLRTVLERQSGIVGVSTYTYSISKIKEICSLTRAISPESWIIAGGAHATFAAEKTLHDIPEIDYIIRGEAEDRFLQVCRLLGCKSRSRVVDLNISGVVGRDGVDLNDGDIQDHVGNINRIPPASSAFSLFNFHYIQNLNPFFPIIGSRGCRYRCAFCTSPAMWGRKRLRSWKNFCEEIESYVRMGVSAINFRDDDFVDLYTSWPRLLSLLKAKQLRWGCEARVDRLDHQMLQKFVNSGMVRLRVSIETIHEDSLRRLRKGHKGNADRFRQIINSAGEICPDVKVSFMIGIPGESELQVRETVEYACMLKGVKCCFWPFAPLPGAAITETPGDYGICVLPHGELDVDYSVIETDTLSNGQINKLLKYARRRVGQLSV